MGNQTIDWHRVKLAASFMVEEISKTPLEGFTFDPGGGLTYSRLLSGAKIIHYAISDDGGGNDNDPRERSTDSLCGRGGTLNNQLIIELWFRREADQEPFRVNVCKWCRDVVKENVARLNREREDSEQPLSEVRDLESRAVDLACQLEDALQAGTGVNPRDGSDWHRSFWRDADRSELHGLLDKAIDRHNSLLEQSEAKRRELEART